MTANTSKRIKPVIEEIVAEAPQNVVEQMKNVEEPQVLEKNKPETKFPIRKEKFSISLGFLMITIIVAIVVAVLSGAIYVYFNGIQSIKIAPKKTATPSPTTSASPSQLPTPTPSPTKIASPTPSIKLSDLKINILNGSGKIGEAGKVKALLEKAGFKVSQTGNAANFNFTDTIVQIKSTISADVINKIKDALKTSFTVADGTTLDAKSNFDIVVTVGK